MARGVLSAGARVGLFRRVPLHPVGFTLLELLVVIAIIAILSSLAIAALGNVSRSANLTNAAQRVGDQLAMARQAALTRNLPVEVRFYQVPDWDADPGAVAEYWRAVQGFVRDGTNATPLALPVLLPARVAINEQASPLWGKLTNTGSAVLPGFGSRSYRAITFRPNAMVDGLDVDNFNPAQAYLVLHHENEAGDGGALPANFAVVQLNPLTGKVTVLRP
jgi:uncharacterized protein (TIGR02596 family)